MWFRVFIFSFLLSLNLASAGDLCGDFYSQAKQTSFHAKLKAHNPKIRRLLNWYLAGTFAVQMTVDVNHYLIPVEILWAHRDQVMQTILIQENETFLKEHGFPIPQELKDRLKGYLEDQSLPALLVLKNQRNTLE